MSMRCFYGLHAPTIVRSCAVAWSATQLGLERCSLCSASWLVWFDDMSRMKIFRRRRVSRTIGDLLLVHDRAVHINPMSWSESDRRWGRELADALGVTR